MALLKRDAYQKRFFEHLFSVMLFHPRSMMHHFHPKYSNHINLYLFPIPSMYGIFTYIWLIFMVNVGKYTYQSWILWVLDTEKSVVTSEAKLHGCV